MKKIILLFSHKLSDAQKNELSNFWHVESFVYLPDELQKIWSNISPDLESLYEIVNPIKEFLKEHADEKDLVLVQGDFGACYTMVNYAKSLKLVAIYATTKRDVIEEIVDGKSMKKSIFEHGRFREYGK